MGKNGKYWGFMEQNEVIKDTMQHISAAKEIVLLIYEYIIARFYNQYFARAFTFCVCKACSTNEKAYLFYCYRDRDISA